MNWPIVAPLLQEVAPLVRRQIIILKAHANMFLIYQPKVR